MKISRYIDSRIIKPLEMSILLNSKYKLHYISTSFLSYNFNHNYLLNFI